MSMQWLFLPYSAHTLSAPPVPCGKLLPEAMKEATHREPQLDRERRDIEELVAFEGRWPGTDAERRAAGHLAERLKAIGREALVEPVPVWPSYPLAHTLHALLAIAGSVVSVGEPALGLALVAVAAVSAFGDLTGSFHLARRLFGRRSSQNVFSPEDTDKPGRLVLVAHYDAARTGAVFSRRALERRAALGKRLHRTIGPFEPFLWSIVAVLACVALRLAGVSGTGLTVVQLVPTVALIASVPLLVDIALSPVVPGANDNASGVATALRLAERYGGGLEHFDLWVVLTGAEEAFGQGMAGWLREHAHELDRERTAVLCIDKVGAGTVRYLTKEGFAVALRYHPALLELCGEVAAGGDGARPYASRSLTDAHIARARGYPAVSIACLNALDYYPHYHQPTDTPDKVEPEALERVYGFCAELIELIDTRIGPHLRSE